MKINDIKNEDLLYFGERIEPYFASSIIIRGMLIRKNLDDVLQWKNGVRWVYTNNYFFMLVPLRTCGIKSIIPTKYEKDYEITNYESLSQTDRFRNSQCPSFGPNEKNVNDVYLIFNRKKKPYFSASNLLCCFPNFRQSFFQFLTNNFVLH